MVATEDFRGRNKFFSSFFLYNDIEYKKNLFYCYLFIRIGEICRRILFSKIKKLHRNQRESMPDHKVVICASYEFLSFYFRFLRWRQTCRCFNSATNLKWKQQIKASKEALAVSTRETNNKKPKILKIIWW